MYDMKFSDIINSGKYVGGDFEIQGTGENHYLYRGKIKSIEITDDNDLKVEFDIFLQFFNKWELEDNKPYAISLIFSSISDVGDDRLVIVSPLFNEMGTLFIADKTKMDWEKYGRKEL